MAITCYHAYLPPARLRPLGSLSYAEGGIALHDVLIPTASQRSALEDGTTPRPSTSRVQAPSPSEMSGRRSKRPRTSGLVAESLDVESHVYLSSINTTVSLSGRTQSLAGLPRWTVPVSKLTPLSTLVGAEGSALRRSTRRGGSDERRRVTVLCCVMAVEAPVQRRRRQSARGRPCELWIASWRVSAPAGKSNSLSDPVTCDVKLWDDCARDWGSAVRKGDVVLLQDIDFQPAAGPKHGAQLVYSTSGDPAPPQILYRTLPRYAAVHGDYEYRAGPRGAATPGERGAMLAEDRALRPDLRLARSDPGTRSVAELAQWCAEWVGGEGPPS